MSGYRRGLEAALAVARAVRLRAIDNAQAVKENHPGLSLDRLREIDWGLAGQSHAALDVVKGIEKLVSEAEGGTMTDLFVDGEFVGASGATLPFKIDCDALSDADLDALARQFAASKRGRYTYGEIVGVPRGGLRFAEAVRRYVETNGNPWQSHLIVDDVLTTGGSMERLWRERWPTRFPAVYGLVIFARGPYPHWVTPIFTLNQALVGANR